MEDNEIIDVVVEIETNENRKQGYVVEYSLQLLVEDSYLEQKNRTNTTRDKMGLNDMDDNRDVDMLS